MKNFNTVSDDYLNSLAFLKKAPRTQKDYERLIKRIAEDIGSRPVKSVTGSHARQLYEGWYRKHGARTSQYLAAVASVVWEHARMRGVADFNPFLKIGIEVPKRRQVTWKPGQIQAFIKAADELGYASLGTCALLCYELCQRRSDILSLRWDAIEGATVTLTQSKRGATVVVPLSEAAQARLLSAFRWGPLICANESTGRQWTESDLSLAVRKIRKAAELPDTLRLADLRRTGIDELADAGATPDELMTVSGHQNISSLRPYVTRNKVKAQNAMAKRWSMRDESHR